jgi:hypothetical protein
MSKLYEAVETALAKGLRTTEEIVGECRRSGLGVRPETVELFLHLAREFRQTDGGWGRGGGGKADRIVSAIQNAFAAGGAYVPVERLARFLGPGDPVTVEEIDAACRASGQFRRQGKFLLRG